MEFPIICKIVEQKRIDIVSVEVYRELQFLIFKTLKFISFELA